ncbi:MAG: hypothetical protein AABX88_03300 [Nanoarchaeota archaeon]
MTKFIENLQKAEKIISRVDYIAYVTFPLLKNKKLLLKMIRELKEATTNCITAILQYEYLLRRIKLDPDPKINFKTFKEKCSEKYQITEREIKLIVELFEVAQKHKESSMEIAKNGNVIILSERMEPRIITIEKTKEFLGTAKSVLRKTKTVFQRKI